MTENTFYTHLFRFYSKSLAPPYNELGLELLHIFRQMEIACQDELHEQLAAHCLDILNFFQGEDMSTLQGEYTRMFSYTEGEEPAVSIRFTSYGDPQAGFELMEKMYDSLLEISYDESPDSIINFLDFYSYLSENENVADYMEKFIGVAAAFSRHLNQAANINFYREVATGLNELCLFFNEEDDLPGW
jgi:nitrate reductase assembly molybdenum cofactor insertion protein NarJ